jgi:hypothetical protein
MASDLPASALKAIDKIQKAFLLWRYEGGEGRMKDRLGDQRGGSEWEPIKILLKGDRNSNKMN